jgi:hypothetical protein
VDSLNDLLGCVLLVGIDYLDEVGGVADSVQFAGVVTSVDPVVQIDVGKEEPFTLPPEPDAFDCAKPGVYRLRGTGVEVTNPDFVTSWTVTPPSE